MALSPGRRLVANSAKLLQQLLEEFALYKKLACVGLEERDSWLQKLDIAVETAIEELRA